MSPWVSPRSALPRDESFRFIIWLIFPRVSLQAERLKPITLRSALGYPVMSLAGSLQLDVWEHGVGVVWCLCVQVR